MNRRTNEHSESASLYSESHTAIQSNGAKETPVDDIRLPELAGKVIVSARITQASVQEQELSLEFTDGTSFSFSCTSKVKSETSLYRGGVGEPEVIRNLTLD